VTCPREQDTLGAIFRDGLRMAFGETTLMRRVVTLGVVCAVSTCTLVILGCMRVAERMGPGARRSMGDDGARR
jgi:hypothetical protein